MHSNALEPLPSVTVAPDTHGGYGNVSHTPVVCVDLILRGLALESTHNATVTAG